MKEAYVNFLNHCYVDTEVEMKEIYASNHMWTVFEKSFLPDLNKVADQLATAAVTNSSASYPNHVYITRTRSHRKLVNYVCDSLITVINSFFGSPFSSTAAAAAAAAAASSTSSPEHIPHHHRLQTNVDDDGVNSSSTATTAISTINTNTITAVQVRYLGQVSLHKIIFEY